MIWGDSSQGHGENEKWCWSWRRVCHQHSSIILLKLSSRVKEIVIVSFFRNWREAFECWSFRKVERSFTKGASKESLKSEEGKIETF